MTRNRNGADQAYLRALACLCGVALVFVMGCGGKVTPTETVTTPVPTPVTTPVSSTVSPSLSLSGSSNYKVPSTPIDTTYDGDTKLAGLFATRSGDAEYISLAIPLSAASRQVRWYAWHFLLLSRRSPYLLNGTVDLGTNGEAQSAVGGISEQMGSSTTANTLKLTKTNLSGFKAVLTPSQGTNPSDQSYTGTAMATANFDSAHKPLLSELTGSWTGLWFDALDVYDGSISFDTNGAFSQEKSFSACDLSTLTLRPSELGNFFEASVVMGRRSSCRWSLDANSKPIDKQLAGVAVIVKLDDGSRRLDMMLLDSAGTGISYRGLIGASK